ncbi:MAG TPA: hypothetical protein VI318_10530, partial [Baekduia sp.]
AAGGTLSLSRCSGGHGTTLARSDGYFLRSPTLGSGVASWIKGGAIFAYRQTDDVTYRYSVGSTSDAVVHTSRAIFAARQIQEERDGSFTATLLTARIPVAQRHLTPK